MFKVYQIIIKIIVRAYCIVKKLCKDLKTIGNFVSLKLFLSAKSQNVLVLALLPAGSYRSLQRISVFSSAASLSTWIQMGPSPFYAQRWRLIMDAGSSSRITTFTTAFLGLLKNVFNKCLFKNEYQCC